MLTLRVAGNEKGACGSLATRDTPEGKAGGVELLEGLWPEALSRFVIKSNEVVVPEKGYNGAPLAIHTNSHRHKKEAGSLLT